MCQSESVKWVTEIRAHCKCIKYFWNHQFNTVDIHRCADPLIYASLTLNTQRNSSLYRISTANKCSLNIFCRPQNLYKLMTRAAHSPIPCQCKCKCLSLVSFAGAKRVHVDGILCVCVFVWKERWKSSKHYNSSLLDGIKIQNEKIYFIFSLPVIGKPFTLMHTVFHHQRANNHRDLEPLFCPASFSFQSSSFIALSLSPLWRLICFFIRCCCPCVWVQSQI